MQEKRWNSALPQVATYDLQVQFPSPEIWLHMARALSNEALRQVLDADICKIFELHEGTTSLKHKG